MSKKLIDLQFIPMGLKGNHDNHCSSLEVDSHKAKAFMFKDLQVRSINHNLVGFGRRIMTTIVNFSSSGHLEMRVSNLSLVN